MYIINLRYNLLMISLRESEKKFVTSMGLLSLLCLGLFAFRAISSHSLHYIFIPENLILAWVSLIVAWRLKLRLKVSRWRRASNLALTFIWLIFLPNSWYVLTDLVHIYPSGEINQLYDIALIGSLVLCGFFLGFSSLYLIHQELLKRSSATRAAIYVEIIILLSSFGIYLGRILRWSSWDVVTNPGGIILNISDRIVDPFAHLSSFSVTAIFFITLSVMYLAFYSYIQPLPKQGH
jgi:uncharacterized membrane protein